MILNLRQSQKFYLTLHNKMSLRDMVFQKSYSRKNGVFKLCCYSKIRALFRKNARQVRKIVFFVDLYLDCYTARKLKLLSKLF